MRPWANKKGELALAIMSNFKIPAQSRTFVFTNFNLDFDYKAVVDRPGVDYIAYGAEVCPTTNRAHHQGWIRLSNSKGVSTSVKNCIKLSKEFLGGCWMEGMGGSLAQNDRYCSKENSGTLIEFGTRPKQGERGDLKDVVARVMAGASVDDLLIDDPGFYHQFGRTLRDAEDVALRKRWRTWMTMGIWLWGPTSVGKTFHAMTGFDGASHYVKNLKEEFWNGYTGQANVIFNEFRGQVKFGELLDLVDKWPKSVPIKCREQQPFLAKKVMITSCKPPEAIYSGALDQAESIAQLERRFIVIHLDRRYSKGEMGALIKKGTKRMALLRAYASAVAFEESINRTNARIIMWRYRAREAAMQRIMAVRLERKRARASESSDDDKLGSGESLSMTLC